MKYALKARVEALANNTVANLYLGCTADNPIPLSIWRGSFQPLIGLARRF
jgi:hypothetical protein